MGRDARYRPKLTPVETERRRLLAAEDLMKTGEDKMTQAEIAREYGVSEATVSRWAKTLREEGVDGLRRPEPKGRPRLTDEDLGRLLEVLLDGALARGYDTDIWTGLRVAEVIREDFGVDYHPDYVPLLMRTRLGMSYQKPRRLAGERDEAARATWVATTWPDLKKSSRRGTPPSSSSTRRGSASSP